MLREFIVEIEHLTPRGVERSTFDLQAHTFDQAVSLASRGLVRPRPIRVTVNVARTVEDVDIFAEVKSA